ncbi:MAG TPA: T9SS type A sorting domain-containing protein, partial [Flavobacterium sp.]|nr:T9SS type A sorting domain-containing protein [Flavobacterium sp.]
TQSITNTAQTGYVSFFEMQVPVRLNLSNSTTLDVRLNNTFGGQSFNVALPAGTTITGVIFDPNKDIISRNSTATLSSDDFTFSNQVSLFPNPSNDYVEIELPDYAQLQKVNFYTILGQKAFETNTNKINISGLSDGVYSIIIETTGGKALKKFIKN